MIFLARYLVSIKYLLISLNVTIRSPNRQIRELEKVFEKLYVTTYKYFPPIFFIDMFIGNFMYFAFDNQLFKTCAYYNSQFSELTNFCTIIFCVGYVMVVYYLSIWVSVTFFN
jgi:hypothetical protein